MILEKNRQRNETTVPRSKVCHGSNDETHAGIRFHPECKLTEFFFILYMPYQCFSILKQI